MTKTKTSAAETDGPLQTVKEIAILDHCSEKTVRRAIDAGLLQVLRIGPGGRLLRVTKGAHEAYRRTQRV